jgi:hypothetical protein
MLDKYSMPTRQPKMMVESSKKHISRPNAVIYTDAHLDKEANMERLGRQQLEQTENRGELHHIIGGL